MLLVRRVFLELHLKSPCPFEIDLLQNLEAHQTQRLEAPPLN
jgi:hypothetical protein